MINFRKLSLKEQAEFLLAKLHLPYQVESRKDMIDPTIDDDGIVIDGRMFVTKGKDEPLYVACQIVQHAGSRDEPPSEDFIEVDTSDRADITLLAAIEAVFRDRLDNLLESFDEEERHEAQARAETYFAGAESNGGEG